MPPAVEKVLDERTSMGVIGDLSQYMKYKTADAMGDAANNPGMAGGGMSMGMGFAMANQMAEAMKPGAPQQGGGSSATPPPLPGASSTFFVAQDGQQTGPFDMAQLRSLASERKLTSGSLVWTAGMAAWQQASEVAELQELLSQVPPPLPPH